MNFWLKDIPKPRCKCGRAATRVLMNANNAELGYWCAECGRREALRLNAEHARAHKDGQP